MCASQTIGIMLFWLSAKVIIHFRYSKSTWRFNKPQFDAPLFYPGIELFSQRASPQVSSLFIRFTAKFGMGLAWFHINKNTRKKDESPSMSTVTHPEV